MERIAVNKPLKTYSNTRKAAPKVAEKPKKVTFVVKGPKKVPLTTKRAVELLLSGKLRDSVCRYCLHIAQPLSELDQIMQIGGRGALYSVTIRDMVACFHPFKVVDDINFPNKVCEKCLDHIIQSYLFAQQCEQSERAIRNCFDDMYEKLDKLDPIDRPKKRGRQKLNPNHNILYTEHRKVIDYAEPIRNLINSGSTVLTNEPEMSELECKKCWQLLPNIESLVNHEKMHPTTMWYHCRTCGRSFPKHYQIRRHLRQSCKGKPLTLPQTDKNFQCKQCGFVSDDYKIHLQHIEKHKFQMVLEHLVERNTEKLCAVCLEKDKRMVDLDKMICVHGGFPELMGDRSLYNILGSTVPEMNIMSNYTSSKICEKCLDHAITSYVFINRTRYIRDRLDRCITDMINKLKELDEPKSKIFIEIALKSILPMEEQYDESLLLDETDDIDETKLKVDVLEDEFRIKSESEESSDSESKTDRVNLDTNTATKTNLSKLVNGYTITNNNIDVCSEFLTFKKKKPLRKRRCKFTCPMCNKHFISDHYLKRHVLKHINRKVICEICNCQFKTKFYLFEHIKMAHLLNKPLCYPCKTCGRMFENDTKRLEHEKCHITRVCELCSKAFISQKHHDNHMQRHAMKLNILNQTRVQTCSFCEKECADDNHLSVHVNKVHLQIKPYACDMCERQFYTETNLRQHKKVHSIISKETCVFCKKTLKCRRDFVVHLRKHIGVRPYKCILCCQEFYSEIGMKSHMKKWHGGRFCCKLCRKVFVNKIGLKNHVNIAHSVF